MFINPETAIAEGWITGIANPDKQVQPNAIDFTLDTLFDISSKVFTISESEKEMRGGKKLVPDPIALNGGGLTEEKYWWLTSGGVYDGMSNVYVTLPKGVAAMTIVRSTLNRNGLFLTSGLYDSGFEGHIGFALHNRAGAFARIAQGTRVGQIIFVSSDSAGVYAGGYNHAAGTHYSEDSDNG